MVCYLHCLIFATIFFSSLPRVQLHTKIATICSTVWPSEFLLSTFSSFLLKSSNFSRKLLWPLTTAKCSIVLPFLLITSVAASMLFSNMDFTSLLTPFHSSVPQLCVVKGFLRMKVISVILRVTFLVFTFGYIIDTCGAEPAFYLKLSSPYLVSNFTIKQTCTYFGIVKGL